MEPTCCAEESETRRKMQIPTVSEPAPPWSGVAVINSEFQELSSSSFAGKYLVLLFYPCNFSLACPSELIRFNERIAEFRDLDSEVVAVSTDSEFAHFAWIKKLRERRSLDKMKIPLLADKNRRISVDYGVLEEKKGIAHRALFVIDRQQVIRHVIINDETISRSVDEVLRIIKACCFIDEYSSEKPDYFGVN